MMTKGSPEAAQWFLLYILCSVSILGYYISSAVMSIAIIAVLGDSEDGSIDHSPRRIDNPGQHGSL